SVAGGCRVGRVEVAMRVHPDDAERALRSHAADRADGHGVIAAQEDGEVLRAALPGDVVDGLAGRGDGTEMAHPAAARLHPALSAHGVLVALGYGDVARVVHIVAQAHEAVVEPGVADGARSHVDAAALLPQVHGYADDLDATRVKIDRHGVTPYTTLSCRSTCSQPLPHSSCSQRPQMRTGSQGAGLLIDRGGMAIT